LISTHKADTGLYGATKTKIPAVTKKTIPKLGQGEYPGTYFPLAKNIMIVLAL
jgi:hypothetical protein